MNTHTFQEFKTDKEQLEKNIKKMIIEFVHKYDVNDIAIDIGRVNVSTIDEDSYLITRLNVRVTLWTINY